MWNKIRPALSLFLALTVIVGVAYPLAVTLAAQTLFPARANGSMIVRDGRVVGSKLIGQEFTSNTYFWGRPSATSPTPYNAASSGGSNFGPSNPALRDAVAARVKSLRESNPGAANLPVPVDLVTTSGSGLDPEISIAAARFQVARVAAARGIAPAKIEALIDKLAARPIVPGFGEPIVNVLALNLALDGEK
jgi:potassium-transporting ATPase KdpC subunit